MANHTIICPFLNQDPTYAHGVEFGMLFARMQVEERVADYFTMDNQDQILLLAARLKWTVEKINPWGEQWFWIEMSKL